MLEMKNLDQVEHERKGKKNAVSEERNRIYSNPSRFSADPEYSSDKMIVQPSGSEHVGSALKKQKLGNFKPETESESRQSYNSRDNKELIQFGRDAHYKEADPFSINPIKTDRIITNFKIKDEDLLFKLELGPSNPYYIDSTDRIITNFKIKDEDLNFKLELGPSNPYYIDSTDRIITNFKIKYEDLLFKLELGRSNPYYIDSVKQKKTRTNMTRSEDVSPDGSCKGKCGVVESENTKPLETKMIRFFGKDIYVECRGDTNTIQASYELKRVGNLGDDSRNGECIVSENEDAAPCETERIRLFGKDIYARMHK